jgi:acetyl esterase
MPSVGARSARPNGLLPVARPGAQLVATAELDPLCDEAREYAARLRADGVEVTELHYEGQVHGFLAINGDFNDSVDLTRQVGTAINSTFQESKRRFV